MRLREVCTPSPQPPPLPRREEAEGDPMLLLRVPGPRVRATLHQEERGLPRAPRVGQVNLGKRRKYKIKTFFLQDKTLKKQ